MEKFKELVSLCKASVEISVNYHKDYYESVEQHFKQHDTSDINDIIRDIGQEIWDEMIKRDTIVNVQAYPRTPIGFVLVYHYDIDKAVELALEAVKTY